MSHTEVQRFATAVQSAPGLIDSYRTASTPAELGARLRSDGYDIADDEIAEYQRRSTELTEDQLDQVAGGGLLTLGVVVGSMVGALLIGGAIPAVLTAIQNR